MTAQSLAEELWRLAEQIGFTPEERAIMQAAYERETARLGQMRAYRATVAEPGVIEHAPRAFGPPSDWAHDGTELRGRTEPGYRCHVCRDAGFVRREVPVGHADFGKPHPCRCRTEDPAYRHEAWQRRVRRAGLPPDAEGQGLASFVTVEPSQRDAVDAAREFLHRREQGDVPRWLALYGGTGRGKTHLLAAVANAVLLTDSVLWATVPELLDQCQAPGEVDGERRPFALDAALTQAATLAPVLILDELGSQQDTDWSRRKLETLLNARYEAGRPTLLGITIKPLDFATWSPRVASRLSDETRVRSVLLEGPDWRQRRGGAP